ncbi:unnamed protein product, partial [Discosporangium mesarthrocarpum]
VTVAATPEKGARGCAFKPSQLLEMSSLQYDVKDSECSGSDVSMGIWSCTVSASTSASTSTSTSTSTKGSFTGKGMKGHEGGSASGGSVGSGRGGSGMVGGLDTKLAMGDNLHIQHGQGVLGVSEGESSHSERGGGTEPRMLSWDRGKGKLRQHEVSLSPDSA